MSIELPTDNFVKPLDSDPDVFQFRYDFVLEGKALEDSDVAAETVTELENGDLLIEGYAAVFEGVDREGENFVDGAFQKGIKSFLNGQASLNFHHKHDHGIGRVLDLSEEQGKGLKMKARVDYQPESSPLRYIYNAVKKGTYRGLSVGGFFRRKMTELGQRIADTDITEISITPVPVHPGTNFAVVAGKALEDVKVPKPPKIDGDIRAEDQQEIEFIIQRLDGIFTRLKNRGKGPQKPTSDGIVV